MSPEHWLRVAVDEVPALLMPAAHPPLQAQQDLGAVAAILTPPGAGSGRTGLATIGFDLRHLSGNLPRRST